MRRRKQNSVVCLLVSRRVMAFLQKRCPRLRVPSGTSGQLGVARVSLLVVCRLSPHSLVTSGRGEEVPLTYCSITDRPKPVAPGHPLLPCSAHCRRLAGGPCATSPGTARWPEYSALLLALGSCYANGHGCVTVNTDLQKQVLGRSYCPGPPRTQKPCKAASGHSMASSAGGGSAPA